MKFWQAIFIVLSMVCSGTWAQSFPDEADVLRRLDSIESRLSILEAAVRPVRSASASPSSFQLAPGERLVAVDGVPVGFPTLAVPITRTTIITPRRYQESLRFSAPSYYPRCNGPDCR
jgi:hypothetical protein